MDGEQSKTTEPYPGYNKWHGRPIWRKKMPWRLARSIRNRMFAQATDWGQQLQWETINGKR